MKKTLGKNTEKHLTVTIGRSLKLINLLLLEIKKYFGRSLRVLPTVPDLGLVSSHNLIKSRIQKNTGKCFPQTL